MFIDFGSCSTRLERGDLSRVAFAAAAGPSWTLPTYELALLTASWVADRHLTGIELAVVTPEEEPLAEFRAHCEPRAARRARRSRHSPARERRRPRAFAPGGLRLASGQTLEVDQMVALPKLEGPRLPGLPADDSGFIQIDDYARVVGLDNVYAAGDAYRSRSSREASLPSRPTRLSRRSLRASARASSHHRSEPLLRGMLLTGIAPTYLRAAVGGEVVEDSELAATPLWWPPTKIAGRYLGPYLAETARRQDEEKPLEDRPVSSDDPREVLAGHREARELALSFALADANSDDYRSALRWLEVVEQLDGVLPAGYVEKRNAWRERARG